VTDVSRAGRRPGRREICRLRTRSIPLGGVPRYGQRVRHHAVPSSPTCGNHCAPKESRPRSWSTATAGTTCRPTWCSRRTGQPLHDLVPGAPGLGPGAACVASASQDMHTRELEVSLLLHADAGLVRPACQDRDHLASPGRSSWSPGWPGTPRQASSGSPPTAPQPKAKPFSAASANPSPPTLELLDVPPQ